MESIQSSAVTDNTLPPPGTRVVATAEGRGAQIYHCAAQGNTFAWTFDAPQATLFQPGTAVKLGTHTIGPAWTWNCAGGIPGYALAAAESAAGKRGSGNAGQGRMGAPLQYKRGHRTHGWL